MAEKEVEAKPRMARRGLGGKVPNSRAASVDNMVIERKNKQLNQATKQLEEKVKSLAQKSQNQKSNVSSTGSNSNIKTTRALPKVVKVGFFT